MFIQESGGWFKTGPVTLLVIVVRGTMSSKVSHDTLYEVVWEVLHRNQCKVLEDSGDSGAVDQLEEL